MSCRATICYNALDIITAGQPAMPLHETSVGTVETLEWGDGPEQIILLHAATSSPHALAGLAECLARPNRRIIAPMLNGYGRTKMRVTGNPVEKHLAVAAALKGLYPGERQIVFGHSMGGLVALLSSLGDDPPDALVLFEPIVIGVLDPNDKADREARDWDRALVRKLAAAVAAGEPETSVAAFVEGWNEVAWNAIPAAARTRLVEAAPFLATETDAVGEQQIDMDALVGLAAPVLLLQGTASPDLPNRAIQRLRRQLPRAQCASLDGLGHMAPVMMHAIVAAAVGTFLSQA
jgi:pimeloyl-ACP methyl ester carboxylesterase